MYKQDCLTVSHFHPTVKSESKTKSLHLEWSALPANITVMKPLTCSIMEIILAILPKIFCFNLNMQVISLIATSKQMQLLSGHL
jgi:hypothetical protein